jgi:hypothetical protein
MIFFRFFLIKTNKLLKNCFDFLDKQYFFKNIIYLIVFKFNFIILRISLFKLIDPELKIFFFIKNKKKNY